MKKQKLDFKVYDKKTKRIYECVSISFRPHYFVAGYIDPKETMVVYYGHSPNIELILNGKFYK